MRRCLNSYPRGFFSLQAIDRCITCPRTLTCMYVITVKPNVWLCIFTEKPNLPFFIKRSKYNNIPVYTDYRSGRTRKLTIIRRVKGDLKVIKIDVGGMQQLLVYQSFLGVILQWPNFLQSCWKAWTASTHWSERWKHWVVSVFFKIPLNFLLDYMIDFAASSLSCMLSWENLHDQLQFMDWIISYKMIWEQTC